MDVIPQRCLKSAGAALDRAKEQGGNNYQFYTAGGTTRALRQLVLESNLRPGLERKEFFIQYQPQVTVNDCHLVGMEALVRWQHPGLGLLYPKEFIHLAEESGLIISLGDWVFRDACFQNRNWQQLGLKPMRLAVNFSARQFQQPTFISDCRGDLEGDEPGSYVARIRNYREFDNEGSGASDREVTRVENDGYQGRDR